MMFPKLILRTSRVCGALPCSRRNPLCIPSRSSFTEKIRKVVGTKESRFNYFSYETIIWFHRPLNWTVKGLVKSHRAKIWRQMKDEHRYKEDLQFVLGAELAAAHCVVSWGGSVKFEGHEWTNSSSLPKNFIAGLRLEAIDLSETAFMYESFENFDGLENLKYLSAHRCEYFTDWCIEKVARHFSNTLVHLDVSDCPRITERGLGALHKCRKLRLLNADSLHAVRAGPTFTLMMEEALPNCEITGLEDWTSMDPAEYYLPQRPYTKMDAFVDKCIHRETEHWDDLDCNPPLLKPLPKLLPAGPTKSDRYPILDVIDKQVSQLQTRWLPEESPKDVKHID